MPITLPLPLLLLLEGLLYVLLFGGLALLRREGLSTRFAVEAVLIILAGVGLTILTGYPTNPIVFLLILYLLTMRVRILVDFGNMLARQGRRSQAARVYDLAARLQPDEAGALIVRLNQGVLDLQGGQLDRAVASLSQVLADGRAGYLSPKHESGCHFNLGVAYRKQGNEPQALRAFRAAIDAWPACEYARHAAIALRGKPVEQTEPGAPSVP